jgi:signal transduction histidine kinase/DNA-binding NarL/FixJ family response regulator
MGVKSRALIRVRVTRHLPMGLGVETDSGEHGLIRLREISLELDHASDWKHVYPIGWQGKAVPLTARKGQIQEFSLRLVESDPWEDVRGTMKRGDLFEGIVTGIVTYGAFIEIKPGITGLLHRSQVPKWAKTSPIELFWPGDRVYVTVEELNYEERKITLSWPGHTRAIGFKDSAESAHSSYPRQDFNHQVDRLLKQDSHKMHFVIVEDDPEQSIAVSSWLRHLGQQVDVFQSAEEALASFEKSTPDIALIDVGLPGMDGLRLSRAIFEKYPKIRVVVTTDWAKAETVMEELDDLQRAPSAQLLVKPLLPEDLIALLRNTDPEKGIEDIEFEDDGLVKQFLDPSARLRSNRLKASILDRLRRYLGFDLAILFSINKPHRQVSILECSGDDQLLNPAAIPQLIYSPVRDVAEDQSVLVINEVLSHSRDRFRYLLELYPHLVAFIGVPVRSRLPADFALFVLDRRPHQISPEQKIYVESAAFVLGTQLEQESFNERSMLIQRSALIGHLTRGMVHEINNLVGPLHSRLDNLQHRLKKMEKNQGQMKALEPDNTSIVDELSEVQNNVRKIINTTRMFGRIAAKGRNEVLRIDEIIHETIHFMRDISEQSHVKISFDPPEHLLVIRNQAAALEQVILNVLLNAVQQISELHAETGGRVHIWIEPPFEMGERTIFRILVKDNGPGIHLGLWERVFEAGYTTRADGSGIGLYISWNLMEEMGGRIYVQESHILSGTTFSLEIPYHL